MQKMNKIDTVNDLKKLRLLFTMGCVLFSIFIHCWGQRKEDTDQLMALMTKQLQVLRPEDRDSFIDLCVSKGEECTESQLSGSGALFSYRVGVDEKSKCSLFGKQIRFWETYKCVYKKKLLECPVDGGWTEWSQWSICRADCEDKGWQSRTRYCENPKPSTGGDACDGLANTNRSCVGPCKGNLNGQDEAKAYITQTHSVFPELENICIEKHCYYEDVQKAIKDKSKVDRYWSSIICVKYSGPCPVNGGWGTWEPWSQCSVRCGNGETYRKRDCNNPTTKNGGIFCIGQYYDSKRCLTKNCSRYESYTDWSDWSSCSESCGTYGVKTSVRSCLNDKLCYLEGTLVKELVKTMPCYGGECQRAGGWSSWGAWSSCTARCGTGRKVRMRRCNEPPPSSGGDCPGPSISVESCDGSYCVQFAEPPKSRKRRSLEITPSAYVNLEAGSTWATNQMQPFSFTNQLSGHNQKVKQIINKPQPNKSASNFASVATSDLNLEAMSFVMPATIKYNSVSEQANLTLELKRQKRAQIQEPKIDEDDPFIFPLNPDIESLYTEWSSWTQCTQSCGGGKRQRRRGCKNKNTVCKGETMPVQFCNADPCPVAGGWGSWMNWSPCSVTCGSGESERYRPCNNPLPLYGGSCSGINSESRPCTLAKCKKTMANTYVTPWTLWSACTTTCGGGTRTRHQHAFWDPVTEVAVCNAVPCSENGMWAAWGGWSSCSLPCGLGITFRDRTCTDPAPVYGGDPCDGQGSEVQTCFGGPCIDEDDYGVLLRGVGYLQYAEHGTSTGFLMVFMRIKLIQERGTLFHHTNKCGATGIDSCDLSILCGMAGSGVHLAIKTPTKLKPVKIMSTTAVEMEKWLDIFVIVTGSWAGMRLNDEKQVVKRYNVHLKHGLNFDGVLMVGANRFKQDGIHGTIAVLRKNFKILILFNMKSWSGYGAPTDTNNVDKIQLPLDARHPNFKARFYSHIFFRESTYLQVLIIFYLTGFNGLLFFNGGKETNSSVAVTVKDGALEFCLDCGEKPLCRKAYELKTDQWYLLRVSATGNEGQIRMNDGDAMQIMCPAGDRYVPRGSLYVGGAGQLDWTVIMELTKNNVLFPGMLDSLVVNDKSVTYKMASLIDAEGWVNTLGYSLADHVSEVYENERATTTLRCGIPERETRSQVTRMIWLQDMKRIVSSPGTDISDSDSTNQSVSSVSLHSSHHYEGVYACLLSSDGVLVNLHVFVLIRYMPSDRGDRESLGEWIVFILLLLIILLCCCPLMIYCCTRNSPFWGRFRKKAKTEGEPLMQPSDTSASTASTAASTATSLTTTPETSASTMSSEAGFAMMTGQTAPMMPGAAPMTPGAAPMMPGAAPMMPGAAPMMPGAAPMMPGAAPMMPGAAPMMPGAAPMMPGEPSTMPGATPTMPGAPVPAAEGMDTMQMPLAAEAPLICGPRRLDFADQITIRMPPQTFHPCPDPSIEALDSSLFREPLSNYPCPSFFPSQSGAPCQDWDPCSAWRMDQPCQDWDPCSAWRMDQPCQPCPPMGQPCPPMAQPCPPMAQPCPPMAQPCPLISRPCFIPRDVYNLHTGPDTIRNIDFLRNPYYLAGTFNPCNFNQNNPSTDSTNNAATGYSNSETDSPSFLTSAGVAEDSSKANKKGDATNSDRDRNICEEISGSEDNENYRCRKQFNETGTGCRTEDLMRFDETFTAHNEFKSFQSKACDFEMSDLSGDKKSSFMNIGRAKHKDSNQSAEMEDSFTSVDVCNMHSEVSNTDSFQPMHCKRLKHLQNLQKYGHKSSRPRTDLWKQPVSSASKGKLERPTSMGMDQQCCRAVRSWSDKNKVYLDPLFTRDTGSNETILALDMHEATGKIARSMKGQHKRTKSLSRLPDTSLNASDIGPVAVQKNPVSMASSQIYTWKIGTDDDTHFTFSGGSHFDNPGNS